MTFPELRAQDFRPWINEDDARRKGLSVEEYSQKQADLWRDGLGSWDQDGDRIRRLKEAAEFTIYTPGSSAGVPVSILASFAAPPAAVLEDTDLLRERIASTATSLLGLLGIDADPIQSREHILLSNLLDHLWRQGQEVDLGRLIQSIQRPPMDRVGVLEMEAFYPEKERFKFAMAVNNLLAAPAFQGWLEGEPLDVGNLLYTPEGKPRVAVFSIAHLSDAERMFFVTLLLNQTLAWMRSRPGTTSLRALLYMDEIFGFMPPVAEPPSKRPLLTLLKQARAYGLGVVLATQNPVDLDYKGLSNAGTWFIGRLQTERDKARVLEGLEGLDDGAGLERRDLEKIISGLGKRVFLLHNVHEDGPVVFHTRWAMSYLRGPLTRQQIQRLTKDRKGSVPAPPTSPRPSQPAPPSPARASRRPVLGPGVPEFFLPSRREDGAPYAPGVLGIARVHYVDRGSRKEIQEEQVVLRVPLHGELIELDWEQADVLAIDERDLGSEPSASRTGFADLPAAAGKSSSYSSWKKSFADYLYRSRTCDLFESEELDVVSAPGESERDFRIRLSEAARERRDEETQKLRKKFASKIATLEERIRRAKQAVEREREQARSHKLSAAISIGATLLSAFTGRKKLSYTTLSRAGTAVRGLGSSSKEKQDVLRAAETVDALLEGLEELNAELEEEIDRLEERFDASQVKLEATSIRPRRSDIEVRLVGLSWS